MNNETNGTTGTTTANPELSYPFQWLHKNVKPLSNGVFSSFILGSFLCGYLLARLMPHSAQDPITPTVSLTEFGGCQFLVFQRPFFVLHWPQCKGPHTGEQRAPVVLPEKPLPPRPANMP